MSNNVPDADMTMLAVRKLSKTYTPDKAPPVVALQDINLDIKATDFVSIVGESGSGKSTLLNILGGLDHPDQGQLVIDGQVYDSKDNYDLADYRRNKVGFVFQDFNLISHMTVLENVKLALSTFRISEEEKNDRARQAVHEVGLTNWIKNKATELSGGQKQRVAVARALVKGPKIILADEPTGALDSETTEDILSLFKSFAQQGKLIIIVTHDENVAAATDRCIRLKDGRVIDDVSTLKIRASAGVQPIEGVKTPRAFNLASVFKLSWHRIIEKRWRYVLISLGISTGIAGLILAQALGHGVGDYLEKSSNQIVDSRKLTISQKDEYFNDDIIYDFRKTGLAEIIQMEFPLQARFDQHKSTEYFGVKPLHRREYQKDYATPLLIEGRLPIAGANEIAVTQEIARQISGRDDVDAESLKGQAFDFKIMSPDTITRYPSRWDGQKLTIVGITKPSFVGEDFAYIPFTDHLNYTKRSRFLGKNAAIPTSKYEVYLKDKAEVETFAEIFRSKYDVITPANILKSVTRMFSQMQVAILAVSGLILFISSIMAGILFFISVLERQKEIGVFKALGGNNRDVRWILFSEAILIGCISSGLGVIISSVVKTLSSPMIQTRFGFDLIAITPFHILLGIAFGILVTALSALPPANNAAKLDPIRLLRKD